MMMQMAEGCLPGYQCEQTCIYPLIHSFKNIQCQALGRGAKWERRSLPGRGSVGEAGPKKDRSFLVPCHGRGTCHALWEWTRDTYPVPGRM